jgi:hypothetical protein
MQTYQDDVQGVRDKTPYPLIGNITQFSTKNQDFLPVNPPFHPITPNRIGKSIAQFL